MADPLLIFDALLGVALIALAIAVLVVRDRFAMIVLFIIFGLMTALAWVRLSAPDVALAEAAIGTGLAGALMLKTLHHIRAAPAAPVPVSVGVVFANMGFCAMVFAGLAIAFMATSLEAPGLAPQVAQNIDASGVAHPVTAVLLNFRAYDTLMEVVVLLAAIIAVWMIERGIEQAPARHLGEIYRGFARLALPAIVVIGTYLLWVGAYAPGGAFQGGAALAAVGLLLLLSGLYRPQPAHRPIARLGFVLGIAVFASVALLVASGGRLPFEYPPTHAKTLILLVEGVVTISIAVTLAALFRGREPEAIPVSETRA